MPRAADPVKRSLALDRLDTFAFAVGDTQALAGRVLVGPIERTGARVGRDHEGRDRERVENPGHVLAHGQHPIRYSSAPEKSDSGNDRGLPTTISLGPPWSGRAHVAS